MSPLSSDALAAPQAGAQSGANAASAVPRPTDPNFGFQLEGSAPAAIPGGEVRRANAEHFPVLRGLAMFSVFLDEGARRAAHFHPNAAELDYIVEGRARVTLVDTQGKAHVVELAAGDVAYMPPAWPHWLENTGEGRLHALFAYSSEQPQTIELAAITAAYAGTDDGSAATAQRRR